MDTYPPTEERYGIGRAAAERTSADYREVPGRTHRRTAAADMFLPKAAKAYVSTGRSLRNRKSDIPQGAAQLRDAHHALAGCTDRNRQPHDGTPTTDDDPNLCSRNGQKGGRGYEAVTKIVREPETRTL